MPASIKVHIAITVLFALLTVAGLLLIILGLTDTYTGAQQLLGEWTLIQLTFLAFICFIIYTVFTFNILMFYLTGKPAEKNGVKNPGTDEVFNQ